jgi:hypothetical protein
MILRLKKLVFDAFNRCDFCYHKVAKHEFHVLLYAGLICSRCLDDVVEFYGRCKEQIKAAREHGQNKNMDTKADGALLHLVRKGKHPPKDDSN